jgi:hypothetical protein
MIYRSEGCFMPVKRTQKQQQVSVKERRSIAVMTRLANHIVALPRLVRVLLAALFGLCVTLSLSPLIDLIYDRYFFSMETRMAPALVSSAFGLVMYMLGWWLMVGTVGERPGPRLAVLWYVGTGVFAVTAVTVLIIFGVHLLNFEA